MKIVIESYKNIETLRQLGNLNFLNKLMPSIEEMIALSNKIKIEPFLYCAKNNNKIVGLSIFIFERRQLHGVLLNTFSLLGHDFFDYNFFYCEEECLNDYLSYVRLDAKKLKADVIVLENIIFNSKEPHCFKNEKVHLFDINLSEKKSFDWIIQKKSLKRHYNMITRDSSYLCEHKKSDFQTKDIDILADLHKQRWLLDDVKSPFFDDDRVKIYLSNKTNKVFTIIRNANDVIAVHYGMILGDVFLWHTPSVNIKYLEYSPIELLLYEIAKFCKANHFSILDFGLGNETYKERFSNTYREVNSKFIPISYKANVFFYFFNIFDIKHIEKIFVKILNLMKINIKKLLKFNNKINYYTFNRLQDDRPHSEEKINQLMVVDTFKDCVEIFNNNNIVPKRNHYNRIKSGDVGLFLLNESGHLLSYGWATKDKRFFVSEIYTTISNIDKILLYDFVTPIVFRRKGYYTLLLKKICLFFNNELAIFSEKKNYFSNKAILQVGFKKMQYQKYEK